MFATVVGTERLKLRRTRVPLVTLAAMLAGPLGIALFMWIVREPGRAAQLGLLGQKAQLAGIEATWASFTGYLVLIVGTGGMVLLAFIVAHVFGSEYAEGTARTMLTLPVARSHFALAKLVLVSAWWAVLVLAVAVEGAVIGVALGLPGWSASLGLETLRNLLVAAAVALLLAPPTAWVTVWTRSYLGALGFAVGALLVGNVLGHTGWGPWFPWSIVPLLVGSVATATTALPVGSYVVLALTCVVGIAGTVLHLRRADVVD
jgi:ABC-type transport system involved in multi-copper enzyme maturation permease subunit